MFACKFASEIFDTLRNIMMYIFLGGSLVFQTIRISRHSNDASSIVALNFTIALIIAILDIFLIYLMTSMAKKWAKNQKLNIKTGKMNRKNNNS